MGDGLPSLHLEFLRRCCAITVSNLASRLGDRRLTDDDVDSKPAELWRE
jgi:hypothetical protein